MTSKRLCAFIKELLTTRSRSKLYLLYRKRKNPAYELPMVGLYRAIMAYFSLAASGCISGSLLSSTEAEQDEDGSEEQEDDHSIDALARRVIESCSHIAEHNGLEFFPRVHLTFGIMQIAQALPASAARILCLTVDSDDNTRTPVEVFRAVLEHLEMNELLLVEPAESREEGISAAELEYALFQATTSFAKCVDHIQ